MAKKVQFMDLKKQNLSYEDSGKKYELLSLNRTKMTVELNCIENQKKSKVILPFAHLPKNIKKLINPN